MSVEGVICKQHSKKVVVDQAKKKRRHTTCEFRLPRRWELISPVRYLKHVGGQMAAAVARVTGRAAAKNDPPPKARSVAPLDSQRSEAIHDCIDFINSSSNLQRSNSAVP